MSKTDSLYPDDADLLLLNEGNKAVCIFEFKKHTLSSNAFSLRATDSFIFELPADKSDNEYKKVIEKISQVIAARS